jgi:N-acetylglucosamine-6-phosphate deacetylase
VPLLDTVNNLVQWQICTPEQAVELAIAKPRHAIKMPLANTSSRLAWYQNQSGQIFWQNLSQSPT